jgi:RNA polymerase sigma factor (sigma-70 family)
VGDINPWHQAGEMVSIEEIIEGSFRDHAAAIRGRALQLTRDPEVAADVTQEAFLRLYVEARAGRLPDNISAWLYRTSANLIVSRARHTAVANRLAPRLVNDDQPAQPEAIAVLRETHDELDNLLARLPAPERAALVMAAHGATGREMARRLGRSQIATRTVLCRARRRLRASFAAVSPVAAPAL